MSQTPPTVFISYPKDKASGQAVARELYQRLHKAGIAAFLDEENIRLGDRWIRTLSEGVQHCKVLLSVVSPASHDRPWVEKEYIAASGVGALIIPVMADQGTLPIQINDLQAAKFYGVSKETAWQQLLERVKEHVAVENVVQCAMEKDYLENLLRDNDERALRFASKVYAPLAGSYRKEHKRVAAACMSPRSRHRRRTDYSEPKVLEGDTTEHDDIIAAFREHKRLVLLGEPGAGKTFSLWRIAAEFAQAALQGVEQLIPVVIPLNRWDSEPTLHDYVLKQMGVLAPEFEALYRAKRLLPLFDALNEIPFDERETKLPQVRQWLAQYPTDYALVTCRERDYRSALELDLDRLTIEPLDPPRVYEFLHNYFNEGDAAHELAENLFWELAGDGMREAWENCKKRGHEQDWELFWSLPETPEAWKTDYWWGGSDRQRQAYFNDSRRLLKLAANPYLLTQIVTICSEPPYQLPSSKFGLFSEFVDDLIFREMEAKPENHYPRAYQAELLAELKQLAWQLQSRSGELDEARTVLSRGDAEQVMPVARLEFAAASSLLVLTADSVQFAHQLLQEYFTAQSFEERRAAGVKASDLWQPDNWWEANGWEEAAKLAAEYEADPRAFLQWLAEGQPKLAAEIAREQGLLDQTLFAAFRETWQAAITDCDNYPRAHARHHISSVLAWLDWDKRKGIGLDENGLPDIDWVEILAGEFLYGKDKETEYLDTFYISRYPITNAQFAAFERDGGFKTDEWWQGLQKPDVPPKHRWSEVNRPVENVSWYDAMAYCRWLSAKTGLMISLPMEQQWEKAVRGVDGCKFPWGDEYIAEYANAEVRLGETSTTCIYPTQACSSYGVSDMAGNVWELCLNKYGEPECVTADLSNDFRVARGGSWYLTPDFLRSAVRNSSPPDYRHYHYGFRVLCSPPSTEH